MPPRLKCSHLPALLLLGTLVGCASRTVPAQFPPTSAAAPGAAAAPPVDVTGALLAEPPLPGQPVTQWPGLRDDTSSGEPASHGGHHAHQ